MGKKDNKNKPRRDFEEMVKAMEEFLKPENLLEKWKTATGICAVHVQFDEPQSDGDFEIIFIPPEEKDKWLKLCARSGKTDIISFEAGFALAQQDNCSGGAYELKELKKIFTLNPALKPEGPEL